MICKNCQQLFEICSEDNEFYQKINVPIPTFCPSCRQQRRLAWRNERTLFQRQCSATGKLIISMYQAETPFPVYDHFYYFSDEWDPLTYGREFDFSRPFFEQFHDLQMVVPRMKNYSISNENAEYGNLSSWNKNCYMMFESDNNEDSLYSEYSFRCKDIVDTSYAKECEFCYECVDIMKCYNLWYSFNCKNCYDSYFLKNCTGCNNCFACINLINKKYCFFNEELTQAEYEKKTQEINLNTVNGIFEIQMKFLDFTKRFPHPFMNGFQNENCTGDNLNNSKNAHFCFNCSEINNSKYIYGSERIKDSYDIDTYGGAEGCQQVYECQSVGRGSFNVAFGSNVYQNISDSQYCDICANSKNIFGCISLRNNENCILNKQYSKHDFQDLRTKIIDHMHKTGEWGEFFPIKYSPFPYNETMAQIYYPLTKDQAIQKGYFWRDKDQKEYQIQQDVQVCIATGKVFRLQKAELEFYKKNNIPLPNKHPDVRYQERMTLRNPQKLWSRNCNKCAKKIMTSYAPDRVEIIYCKECYLKEIY
ncbi:MAG: hypothetical protein V1898_03795 [Patescibacteria group bacterium]